MKKLCAALLLFLGLAGAAQAQQIDGPVSPMICGFTTSPPTIATTKFGIAQCDTRGNITTSLRVGTTTVIAPTSFADATSNSTASLTTEAMGMVFNGTSWDRAYACNNTVVINVTAAATTELVSLTAAQTIRVCSFTVSMSAAGTAQFVYGTGSNCGTGTTNLTGVVPLLASTPWAMSAPGPGTNLFRGATANALCLSAVTGNAIGFLTYAKY